MRDRYSVPLPWIPKRPIEGVKTVRSLTLWIPDTMKDVTFEIDLTDGRIESATLLI